MEVDLAGRRAIVAGPGRLGRAVAASLVANGAEVEVVVEHNAQILSDATARLGGLDILVMLPPDADEQPPSRIDAMCRAAARTMAERGGGRILNIVSAFGVIPARDEATNSAESAAIIALTRVLALEFGQQGILVNALAVGATEGDDPLSRRLLSHVPLARAARFDEIAAAALFLIDPDNSYTTGHVLLVDGGWAAGYARNF